MSTQADILAAIDHLTYASYKEQRMLFPWINPTRWQAVFANAAAMEQAWIEELKQVGNVYTVTINLESATVTLNASNAEDAQEKVIDILEAAGIIHGSISSIIKR